MRCVLGLLVLASIGCGSELTELIPKRKCADESRDSPQGLYSADVATDPQLQLNGAASSLGGVLRLTSASRNAVGSAYFTTPLSLTSATSCFVHFASRISGGDGVNGADGLAFVLQSSDQGAAALGLDGGGLGFHNISPGVALELDTYPNVPDPIQGAHVAIMLNGMINDPPLAWAVPPFVLNDGAIHHTWVDYDAPATTLRVFLSDTADKPPEPLLSYTGLALATVLGPQAWAGFSASAGERFNDHDIVGAASIATTTEPLCEPLAK